MSITTALHHTTHYRYNYPTTLGIQTVRLRPAPHARSNIESYSLKIYPKEHFINWQQDPFGNFMARIVFPDKVKEFKIEVDLITKIHIFNPFDFFLEDYAKNFPFVYEQVLKEELFPYLEIKEKDARLIAWVKDINKRSQSMIDFLVKINQKLNKQLKYVVRLEPGVQSCEETLKLGSGSCRDMTWLLCQALRHLGLATRFASGYLIQLAADLESLDGPSGTKVDFTDLHAWTEVYLPGAGWIGLDPTSGLFVGEGHIPLCCTPNPSSAAPITGTLEHNVRSTLEHTMNVTRLLEPVRVTKPYTDEQWQAIDKLGKKIDQSLVKQDVRLTMGGEPTFISIDEREDNAWKYTALGGNKKQLAKNMLYRLHKKFSPGGMLMFVQGKWYPGEILPRWAMPCFWRKDGEAIWQDLSLLADPDEPTAHNLKTAEKFISQLAEVLKIPRSYILSAYEDSPYYLWKDRRMPLQDEIMQADLYEQVERTRLQELMDNNLNTPVGYVLPIYYSRRRKSWISNKWQFKSKKLVLLTGDSPLGLRLPLSSLPYPPSSENELYPERSNFEKTQPLPSRKTIQKKLLQGKIDDQKFKHDPNGLIHTAICAEVRKEVLHIFLPPVAWVDYFLELITAIELVATKLKIKIVLEGYMPPADKRLLNFSLAPDPGVIEINIQPAENWEELKNITNTVYAEARLARLAPDKFTIDGRRVGTGGGNHIVLGASNSEDSPFLRRPDLLRSLLTFWQNHPALSYVFGHSVGPTSQSPRIDEARHDSLHELEIAFQQVDGTENITPWMVDRLFRNLLVDLTGNTHRAEFCIDKLYNPASERGRLGLIEMRGFEMTPHPQMNLVQNLLIRACIACFWKTPYNGKLVRWGTRLHDQFMLPYYLKEDLTDVLNILKTYGYDLNLEWFEPFFTFRFPECGSVKIGNLTLSIHCALEPWPVMGEEQISSSTSRPIDSTVERLQVMIKDINEERHIVTCNKRILPLQETTEKNVHVAGVRFKAWLQTFSLHPRLPVNAPLVFDVIDVTQKKSIGGCTYHVSHPGGRVHEKLPVNENEAEGRKLARFEPMGHTPGKIKIPARENKSEFNHTLDLRWNCV